MFEFGAVQTCATIIVDINFENTSKWFFSATITLQNLLRYSRERASQSFYEMGYRPHPPLPLGVDLPKKHRSDLSLSSLRSSSAGSKISE